MLKDPGENTSAVYALLHVCVSQYRLLGLTYWYGFSDHPRCSHPCFIHSTNIKLEHLTSVVHLQLFQKMYRVRCST